MMISRAREIEWGPFNPHRDTDKEVKRLLEGDPEDLNNYGVALVREGEEGSSGPRHRHNFDQVRISIDGQMACTPSRQIGVGEIGYFPEGVFYGPENSEGGRFGLTIQFGGPSGLGFMSQRQVQAAIGKLRSRGEFRGGLFYGTTGGGNQGDGVDAFEAIWEEAMGRPIAYPAPRFDEPVIMTPSAFAYRPADDGIGMWRKRLGTFGEGGTELFYMLVEGGGWGTLGHSDQVEVYWVFSGTGEVEGSYVEGWSAVGLDRGEKVTLLSRNTVELFGLSMPRIE